MLQRLRVLLFLVVAAACATTAAPDPVPAAPPAVSVDTVRRGYNVADVRFLQHMIAHHAQALVMAGLIEGRTTSRDFALMGERIAVSQRDEIAAMQRWLATRDEMVPAADTTLPAASAHVHGGVAGTSEHTMHGVSMHQMPGMLTPAEFRALAEARGAAFEERFLTLMIRHHEGAVTMVEDLFRTPGAGREPELFGLANDVVADQRAEIVRMRQMLARAHRNPVP